MFCMLSFGSETPSFLNLLSHFSNTAAIVLLVLMPATPEADDDKGASRRTCAKSLPKRTREDAANSNRPMHGRARALILNAISTVCNEQVTFHKSPVSRHVPQAGTMEQRCSVFVYMLQKCKKLSCANSAMRNLSLEY